ncbi:MAG: hypothetical protein KJ070_16700, partial [Verrucomicrobia bacterium]|nr:hypothetical protein [Verrucomicrobiota bacterium]
RSAHETVWQGTALQTQVQSGQVTERTLRFVEVGSGLNYLNEVGEWVASGRRRIVNLKYKTRFSIWCLASFVACPTYGQGTFQNLDFENGTFIAHPTGPRNSVQFGPAMPGWTGYVGTNQIDWILYNDLFLSTAGIAIFGPNQPLGESHGRYYLVLQAGDVRSADQAE